MNLRALLAASWAAVLTLAAAAETTPPAMVRASYDVSRDGLHIFSVNETFERNGAKYQIVSESTPVGLFAVFIRTRARVVSSGSVTAAGLRPEQFEYGRLDDPSRNVSDRFDWEAGLLRMTFDGRSENTPIETGAQDRVSVMYQFLFLPEDRLRELSFQMTSNGKKMDRYRYLLEGTEQLDTPLGRFDTLHLVKQRDPGENGAEIWLARERQLFPVKLVILENDGSKFEQVITQLEIK